MIENAMSEADTWTLTDDVYVDLVHSLFHTLLPTSIVGASFTLVGLTIVDEVRDPALMVLLGVGVAAACARLATVLWYRNDKAWDESDAVRAGVAERRYATTYLLFATAFGLFTGRAFALSPSDLQNLLVGLVFGYGAGVATGVALRPWISVPSMVIGVVPLIIASVVSKADWQFGLGLLTFAFLAGGIESILRRYRRTARLFSTERVVAGLSLTDEVTGVANQIALRFRFSSIVASRSPARQIALYRVRLDGIEDIGARYGYERCANILRIAADRLRRMGAADDVVARLGGAEFALLQPAIDDRPSAVEMASGITLALSAGYDGTGSLPIIAKVGYAIDSHRRATIEKLLISAEEAIQ